MPLVSRDGSQPPLSAALRIRLIHCRVAALSRVFRLSSSMPTPETLPVPVLLEGLLIVPVTMEERTSVACLNDHGLSCPHLLRLGHVLPGCDLTGMESSITSFTNNSMPLISLPPSWFYTQMNQNLRS